ncbi:MAG TPA: hypothetical protein VNP03_09115 [Pseudonocardia sp.]|nr:hypothetical protein [Pseudonocardia sp.]
MTAAPLSGPAPMRWRVESWDPGYGASTEDQAELGSSTAQVKTDLELPEARWRPIDPDPAAAGWAAVLFVDGVRRIDAMAWISEPAGGDGGAASLALCASYAAGVVCCRPGAAYLLAAEIRRGLFSTAEHATDVVTSAGSYRRVHTPARRDPATDLSLAVQRALGEVEAAVSAQARAGGGQANSAGQVNDVNNLDGEDLLVVDGPLRGRQHLPRALGFIKTHRTEYLPAPLHRVVGALAPGQRTPVFGLGTSWQRHSWYLKLPGSAAPWAGVVRVECPAELPLTQVVELAERSAPMLCRYASTEYKDARAPQNLYPIGGLERELRRRLGDQKLLYRAIRRASAG